VFDKRTPTPPSNKNQWQGSQKDPKQIQLNYALQGNLYSDRISALITCQMSPYLCNLVLFTYISNNELKHCKVIMHLGAEGTPIRSFYGVKVCFYP
jgi:hypothetical protein